MSCVDPVQPSGVPHGVAPPPEVKPPIPPPASKPTVPGSVPPAGTAPTPQSEQGLPAPGLPPSVPRSVIDTGDAASAQPGAGLLPLCVLPPVWDTIPNQSTDQVDLPDALDVTEFVTTDPQLILFGWHLNGAPNHIEIDQQGVILADIQAPVGVHQFTVAVSNNHGEAVSDVVDWEIVADPSPPSWNTVPSGELDEALLPVNVDMNNWAVGFGLFGWALVGNPAGITIDANGIVNIADTVVGAHVMSCNVSNGNGGPINSGNFTWEIVEEHVPAPPNWHTPVPNQSDPVLDQPVTLDMKNYVSSLAPITWGTNIGTINSNGILELDGFAGGLIENISVSAENIDGETFSDFFDWDLVTSVIFEDNFNRSNRNLDNGDNGWQQAPTTDDPMVIRSNYMTLAAGIGGSQNEVGVPPATEYRFYIDSQINLVGALSNVIILLTDDLETGDDGILVELLENRIAVGEFVGGVSNDLVVSAGSTARSIMWEYTTNNLRIELGGVEVFNGAVAPSVGGDLLIAGLSFQTPYPRFDDLLIEAI